MGIHPQTGDNVNVCYGWDDVPGFKNGYFFQAYSNDPTEEGLIENVELLEEISKNKLKELAEMYCVKLKDTFL